MVNVRDKIQYGEEDGVKMPVDLFRLAYIPIGVCYNLSINAQGFRRDDNQELGSGMF